MRIAIIGSGPSGFFVAGEVFKRIPDASVHMYEKRVAPYGLVRYGVSPDHQLTRRVIKMFDQIAGHEHFHYFGNVEIGVDITMDDIQTAHHAVVVCTGAEYPNRPELPGARLPGVVDALDIARWVNGEAEAFDPNRLDGVSTVVIVGNGNVALDVARILAKPAADWVATDMAPHAMEALIHHRIDHVIIAGRRGPAEASFSEAELDEVVSLTGWDVESNEPLPFGLAPVKPASDRKLTLLFHATPEEVLGGDSANGVRFRDDSGNSRIVSADLVVFATGHRGRPVGDWPWDEQNGVINHERGRVAGEAGRYVCGWIKRGAKGLIGQNRKDAIETVACILEDREKLMAKNIDSRIVSDKLNRTSRRIITWSDWQKMDAVEIQKGMALGRPRISLSKSEAVSLLK